MLFYQQQEAPIATAVKAWVFKLVVGEYLSETMQTKKKKKGVYCCNGTCLFFFLYVIVSVLFFSFFKKLSLVTPIKNKLIEI